MSIEICPSRASGTVKAPPSKSCAHRLLLCAALAEGESVISGLGSSEDILATLDCISALGAKYILDGDTAVVTGFATERSQLFSCRESGSTLRFFIPAAMALGDSAVFTGTERLMTRGVGIYENILGMKGILFQKGTQDLKIMGKLTSGDYAFRGDVSSQFVSGLMFALPLLEGDSTVQVLPPVESRAYIDLTVEILKHFGVEVSEGSQNTFYIKGGQHYRPIAAAVEGDWSNAAFLYALNELGGQVRVEGLRMDSTQSDRLCLEHFAHLRERNAEIDISGCPDLGPVLFALAAAENGAVFTGTKRLRIKESDRVEAMAQELCKFGASLIAGENSVIVCPSKMQRPEELLYGHNDHRIVMALAVLCAAFGGRIEGASTVRKSYPDFFSVLNELGVEVHGEI